MRDLSAGESLRDIVDRQGALRSLPKIDLKDDVVDIWEIII
jgi:hypothetical protein